MDFIIVLSLFLVIYLVYTAKTELAERISNLETRIIDLQNILKKGAAAR